MTAAALRTLSCTAILLTASCATAPERDAISMTKSPPHWTTDHPSSNPIATQWLSAFNDPGLSSLVQDALNNNYDLKAAAARVDSAREQVRIDGAPRWPQLYFAPGYQRTALTAGETGVFEALFTMSWEIDVWGRIKAAQQAAGQEAEAVAADYHGAKLSLAARTAQSYFELIEANLQADVAEQSIKDRRVIVELVRGRFARGLTRGLDLRLVLTDLANAEAQLAGARNQVQIVTRRLEVLLGRYPGNSQVGWAGFFAHRLQHQKDQPIDVVGWMVILVTEKRPGLAPVRLIGILALSAVYCHYQRGCGVMTMVGRGLIPFRCFRPLRASSASLAR